MEARISLEEFLEDIDSDLLQYVPHFTSKGFTSNKSMKYWRESDFESLDVQVPEGHRRLIMNSVAKIRTPKRKETPTLGESPQQQKFPSRSSTQTQNEPYQTPQTRRNIAVGFSAARPVWEPKILSPVERFIKAKEDEISEKNAEIKSKKDELSMLNEKLASASRKVGKTGQKCSNCHKRNHTVRSCVEEKCSSAFSDCGDISKHSDEKILMQEKKRAISALETSVRKLNQELVARTATYNRVNQSVHKRIEDMLCEEFPQEYFENHNRNWLKIQKDVALIKKFVKGDTLPSKEIIKNILEGKHTAVTDIQFPHKSKETAMQQKLKSLGIDFSKQKSSANYTNSSDASNDIVNILKPRSSQEEIEQIRMATQLSLNTSTTEQNTDQNNERDEDAASILLSLSQHNK